MAKKNFTQFELRTAPLTGDYLVGYKSDGSTEIRTPINSLLSRSGYITDSNFSIKPYIGNNNINGFYCGIGNGDFNIIEANYAFAINRNNFVQGENAFASGLNTAAIASNSCTFNSFTTADGADAAAFGLFTQAGESSCFATGYQTQAVGLYSSTHGDTTKAQGYASFAINRETLAFGNNSIALNFNTAAIGENSIASGYQAKAIHDFSYIWQSTNYTITTAVYFGVPIPGANVSPATPIGTVINVQTLNTVIPLSTTRTGQFAVGAAGGVFLSGNVGINTDIIDNALTVVGNISATGNIFSANETSAQTLSFNEASKNLTISSGNTVSLSALVDSSIDTGVRALTSIWQDTSTVVQSNSANWILQPVETLSALNLQTVPLSTVTFTGETKTSTTTVTATDVYVKVIVNNETKYLRLFDVI